MNRLAGMDIWRGLLLTLGVFIHCAALAERPALDMIEEVSHLFRMAAFFAISGFFAALTVRKAPSAAWLRQRAIMLAVPMVVGLFTINPLSHLLIGRMSETPGLMFGAHPWHPGDTTMHLWFLIALLLYTPFAPLFLRSEATGLRFIDAVMRRPLISLAIFWLLGTSLLLAGHVIGAQFGKAHLLRQIAFFTLFYSLGYWTFAHEGFRRWFCNLPTSIYLLALALAVTDLVLVGVQASGAVRYAVQFSVLPLVSLAATSLIFRHALAYRMESAFGLRVARASYTIYLLHILTILAIVYLAYPYVVSPYVALLVIAPVVVVGLYLFHTFVVAKVPLLAFVLNGRLPRKQADSPVAGERAIPAAAPGPEAQGALNGTQTTLPPG